jgi:hypothetical protein
VVVPQSGARRRPVVVLANARHHFMQGRA